MSSDFYAMVALFVGFRLTGYLALFFRANGNIFKRRHDLVPI